MEKSIKKCWCKGIRHCRLCDENWDSQNQKINFEYEDNYKNVPIIPLLPHIDAKLCPSLDFQIKIYTFCPECGNKAWLNNSLILPHVLDVWPLVYYGNQVTDGNYSVLDEEFADLYSYSTICPIHNNGHTFSKNRDPNSKPHSNAPNFIEISGIYVGSGALTPAQELELTTVIDDQPWTGSQSGRRKQDYGPRINFKKRRLRPDKEPRQFPAYDLVEAALLCPLSPTDPPSVLDSFRPVELCNLEYDPARGSAIDPHHDDTWAWGPRLVSLSTGSHTVMTLSDPVGHAGSIVRVFVPRRSVLVLCGEARYDWMHGIAPGHIYGRRLVTTLREYGESVAATIPHPPETNNFV